MVPEGMEKGERPEMPEGEMPEGFEPGQMPEGMEPPEGFGQMPEGMEMPEGGFDGKGSRGEFGGEADEANTLFFMQDKVNFFSGLTSA